MTRHEALYEHDFKDIGKACHTDHTVDIVNTLFDAFDKEKQQLEQQIAYWKLSFNKQVEAHRGH